MRPLQSVVRKRLVSMRPNPLATLVSWQISAGCVPDVNPLDFAGDFPRSPGSLSFLYSDLCSQVAWVYVQHIHAITSNQIHAVGIQKTLNNRVLLVVDNIHGPIVIKKDA